MSAWAWKATGVRGPRPACSATEPRSAQNLCRLVYDDLHGGFARCGRATLLGAAGDFRGEDGERLPPARSVGRSATLGKRVGSCRRSDATEKFVFCFVLLLLFFSIEVRVQVRGC